MLRSIKPRYQPIVISLLLLIVAASRLVRLSGLQMERDETWSVWQTFGSPAQIVRWTPYDWPPLFYLTVGAWRSLVGIQPIVIHVLPIFVFLVGAALIYRVTRKLHGEGAAWLAIAAYAAMGYCIHLSTLLRGYIFLMTLAPLMLWLTLRYFDHPSIRRAIPLGVCIAVMFYTHATSALVFMTIGLYTLIVYRQKVWRWWLPGVVAAVLGGPEIINKIQVASLRLTRNTLVTPPILDALGSLFADYTGYVVGLWALLFVVATVLIFYRRRLRPQVLALAVWVVVPIAVYLVNTTFGFFTPRYLAWVMVGTAIWVGWGLSLLPRPAQIAALASLVVISFWAIPDRYGLATSQSVTTLEGLTIYLKWGDVILLDPDFSTIPSDQWDYFIKVYFPNGLQFVTNPDGYRRVWYVSVDGSQDPATLQAIRRNRVASTFIGTWDFLVRLYEAPPDPVGIPFANGLRFHGADFPDLTYSYPLVKREGESVKIRLWWSVDTPPKLDYSVGVQIFDPNGTLIAQSDGAPQVNGDAPRETSRWVPGQFYIEERELTLPYAIRSGGYPIELTVYQWWDNTRIAAPGVNADKLLHIQDITVKSWSQS